MTNIIEPAARNLAASAGENPDTAWPKFAEMAKNLFIHIRDEFHPDHHEAMKCGCGCTCSTEDQLKAAINSGLNAPVATAETAAPVAEASTAASAAA